MQTDLAFCFLQHADSAAMGKLGTFGCDWCLHLCVMQLLSSTSLLQLSSIQLSTTAALPPHALPHTKHTNLRYCTGLERSGVHGAVQVWHG